jgi:hypothetical protein
VSYLKDNYPRVSAITGSIFDGDPQGAVLLRAMERLIERVESLEAAGAREPSPAAYPCATCHETPSRHCCQHNDRESSPSDLEALRRMDGT